MAAFARIKRVVVGHKCVETRHEAFDVDMAVSVAVSFPFDQAACVRQASHLIRKAIVVEVVDQKGGARHQRTRETGTGNKNVGLYVIRRCARGLGAIIGHGH